MYVTLRYDCQGRIVVGRSKERFFYSMAAGRIVGTPWRANG